MEPNEFFVKGLVMDWINQNCDCVCSGKPIVSRVGRTTGHADIVRSN